MPLAVTHVITTIILVDLYRDYVTKHKKYFTLHTVFIAGIAGLLPDIDLVIGAVLNAAGLGEGLFYHGGVTHTPFFAVFFIVPALVLWKKKRHKLAMYFAVITFGILFHIALDFLLGGGAYEGIMWLFPFTLQTWKVHALWAYGITNTAAIDAVILVLWLWHEEVKHKISDFI